MPDFAQVLSMARSIFRYNRQNSLVEMGAIMNIDHSMLEPIVASLSEVYISIHELCLDDDSFHMVKSNPFIDKCLSIEGSLQDKMNNVMGTIAVPEHKDMILEFVDLSTLPERIAGEKLITTVFEGRMNGWCKARFIRMAADQDENAPVHHLLYVVECIDSEKRKQDRLAYMAQTDLLTGLFNRGHGEHSIDELLAAGVPGMFCLFDVDKFKRVNDKYGHDVGDKVLISIAEALAASKREGDVAMRLGGDEFAAYFVGVGNEAEAHLIIDKFFEKVAAISIDPMTEAVSVSMGGVMYSEGLDFDTAYRTADRGVYTSKNNKGSTFLLK